MVGGPGADPNRGRRDGGGHDEDNLVVLCGAHHDAVHRGTLRIEGSPTRGLIFTHADGSPYGAPPSPTAVDATADVVSALRALGFSANDARAAAARSHVGAVGFQDGMRTALAWLRSPS